MSDIPLDYASSGVDIDAEGKAVASLVGALSASVRQKGEFGAPVPLPGGFGGIIEFGDNRLALGNNPNRWNAYSYYRYCWPAQ